MDRSEAVAAPPPSRKRRAETSIDDLYDEYRAGGPTPVPLTEKKGDAGAGEVKSWPKSQEVESQEVESQEVKSQEVKSQEVDGDATSSKARQPGDIETSAETATVESDAASPSKASPSKASPQNASPSDEERKDGEERVKEAEVSAACDTSTTGATPEKSPHQEDAANHNAATNVSAGEAEQGSAAPQTSNETQSRKPAESAAGESAATNTDGPAQTKTEAKPEPESEAKPESISKSELETKPEAEAKAESKSLFGDFSASTSKSLFGSFTIPRLAAADASAASTDASIVSTARPQDVIWSAVVELEGEVSESSGPKPDAFLGEEEETLVFCCFQSELFKTVAIEPSTGAPIAAAPTPAMPPPSSSAGPTPLAPKTDASPSEKALETSAQSATPPAVPTPGDASADKKRDEAIDESKGVDKHSLGGNPESDANKEAQHSGVVKVKMVNLGHGVVRLLAPKKGSGMSTEGPSPSGFRLVFRQSESWKPLLNTPGSLLLELTKVETGSGCSLKFLGLDGSRQSEGVKLARFAIKLPEQSLRNKLFEELSSRL